jgi:hypothetical protein
MLVIQSFTPSNEKNEAFISNQGVNIHFYFWGGKNFSNIAFLALFTILKLLSPANVNKFSKSNICAKKII